MAAVCRNTQTRPTAAAPPPGGPGIPTTTTAAGVAAAGTCCAATPAPGPSTWPAWVRAPPPALPALPALPPSFTRLHLPGCGLRPLAGVSPQAIVVTAVAKAAIAQRRDASQHLKVTLPGTHVALAEAGGTPTKAFTVLGLHELMNDELIADHQHSRPRL